MPPKDRWILQLLGYETLRRVISSAESWQSIAWKGIDLTDRGLVSITAFGKRPEISKAVYVSTD
jgi:hypothetical protein